LCEGVFDLLTMVIAHVMDGVDGSPAGGGAQARVLAPFLWLDGEHGRVP
jgi:hypothetical protein